MFDKIIIVGLGLIGGSIAKSCKKNRLCKEILAFNKSHETLEFAIENHVIDGIYDFKEKISDNDLVIIATPLSKYQESLERIAPNLSKNTIITDVGSVKSFIETDILPNFPHLAKNFVSCHPIAGSDKSGVQNSDANLFQDKKLIIIKNHEVDHAKVERISLFWQEIGSKIEYLTAENHDKIYALVSHLPQKIAFAFADHNELQNANEMPNFLIQKHLRLQNSNPEIWREIFELNKKNIDHYFVIFSKNLDFFKKNLTEGNYEEIIEFLEKLDFSSINSTEIPQNIKQENQEFSLSRTLIVGAFMAIKDLQNCRSYVGSGFRDFTIILIYLKYLLSHRDLLAHSLQHHRNFLLKSL